MIIANPKGIDVPIKLLQAKFLSELFVGESYESYARAYINFKDDKKIAEIYLGDNEYKEIFINDKVDGHSFFVVGNTDYDNQSETDIGIIFCVNVDELITVDHRGDEDIIQLVMTILNKQPYGFKPYEIVRKFNDVFAEFDYDEYRDNMQPKLCFRINCKINYSNINC